MEGNHVYYRKKRKVKKGVIYALIVLVIVIGLSIAGFNYYKKINSYEYKLAKVGYKENEITTILDKLTDEQVETILNKEYNELQTELLAEALEPLLELNETNIISRYKEIFSKVWQNLKDNNIIAKNKKMPGLTPDDLPLNQLRD